MKLFTAATLAVAALISAVVCVPFMPSAGEGWTQFALEVRLATSGTGKVQVYYDSGRGFNEAESSEAPLTPGPRPVAYLLSLPAGQFQQLRFDPTDGDAPVTIDSLRIVTRDGRLIRELPLATVTAQFDIAGLRLHDGALDVTPRRGSRDPQLLVKLAPPLVLQADTLGVLMPGASRCVIVFIVLAAGLWLLDRAPGLRGRLAKGAHRLKDRPRGAIVTAAVLAVVLSSYPVVFLGKSFVSPNLGTVLLYEQFPTLPGYTDSETGRAMLSDIGAIMWQHVPLSRVEARALREGEIPLWNRYNSAGTPLLGQGQSMFGDPLHFLVIAANGAAWAWDLKYLIAKWLFAVALGLSVLEICRASVLERTAPMSSAEDNRATASPAIAAGSGAPTVWPSLGAALLVTAVAPFIGFFLFRLNHPAFFSVCYAPSVLYCWIRAIRAGSLRATAGWAAGLLLANIALMNSGTAKEAYMLLLTMNFAGTGALLAAGTAWRFRLQQLAILVWAGVLFTLITAPIWGTFLHELHIAYTSYNAVSAYQIQPTLLLGLFDEIFYRPLMPANETFAPSLNFVLLLGFLYFVATLRAHFSNRLVMALAVVSIIPLALGFGLVPPAWIVRIPILANVAHLDNTFSCALIVLWSVLAGFGFAFAATRLGRREGRDDLIIVALLLGVLVFAWIAFRQAVHRTIFGPTFTVNQPGHVLAVAPFIWGYLASLLLAAGVAMLAARRTFVRGALTPALGLLLGLCVAVLCWRHGMQAPAAGFESFVNRPMLRTRFDAPSEAIQFLQAAQTREPARAFGFYNNFFPGWNDAYALETINGPDALMSPTYRELISAMSGIRRMWDWRVYLEPRDVAAARPFLDSLNVRYYVDHRGDEAQLEGTLRPANHGDLDVYESPTAWPRAYFAEGVLTYDTVAELMPHIRASAGRPFAAVQRDERVRNPALASLEASTTAEAKVVPATHYRLTQNTTSFDVHATGRGIVVLLEAWWPGDFRVFVNGRKATPIRANHAFLGVVVEAAGDYHVEFRCVPKGWYRNLALCGTGFILLIASGVVVGRKTRSVDSPLTSTQTPA